MIWGIAFGEVDLPKDVTCAGNKHLRPRALRVQVAGPFEEAHEAALVRVVFEMTPTPDGLWVMDRPYDTERVSRHLQAGNPIGSLPGALRLYVKEGELTKVAAER